MVVVPLAFLLHQKFKVTQHELRFVAVGWIKQRPTACDFDVIQSQHLLYLNKLNLKFSGFFPRVIYHGNVNTAVDISSIKFLNKTNATKKGYIIWLNLNNILNFRLINWNNLKYFNISYNIRSTSIYLIESVQTKGKLLFTLGLKFKTESGSKLL